MNDRIKTKDFNLISRGRYTYGMSFDECMEYKIVNKRPFYMKEKGSIKEIYGSSYQLFKDSKVGELKYRYTKSNVENLKEVFLSEVYLDADFGGKVKPENTFSSKTAEACNSLQCYFCSYTFVKSSKIDEHEIFKFKDLYNFTKSRVETDMSFQECLKYVPSDLLYDDTFVRIANKIYSKYESKFNSNVTFHCNSNFVDKIFNIKKQLHLKDKKTDKLVPSSFKDTKWNPSDIWITTLNTNSNPFSECDTLYELNDEIRNLADKNLLMGIALKNVSTSSLHEHSSYFVKVY